jgi:hypothetical protein
MALLKDEMQRFNTEVEDAYAQLAAFTPPVKPLWTKRSGIYMCGLAATSKVHTSTHACCTCLRCAGLFTRTRAQTQKVIIELVLTGEVSDSGCIGMRVQAPRHRSCAHVLPLTYSHCCMRVVRSDYDVAVEYCTRVSAALDDWSGVLSCLCMVVVVSRESVWHRCRCSRGFMLAVTS